MSAIASNLRTQERALGIGVGLVTSTFAELSDAGGTLFPAGSLTRLKAWGVLLRRLRANDLLLRQPYANYASRLADLWSNLVRSSVHFFLTLTQIVENYMWLSCLA